MTPEALFSHSSSLATAGWVILVLGPRSIGWLNLFPRLLIPAILAAVYTAVALSRFSETGGGFGSLADFTVFMTNEWGLLAGWVHYLAFDLIVGCWAAARLDVAGVTRIVQVPVLILVFMLGPIGYLLTILIVYGLSGSAWLEKQATAERTIL
ncbi:abscisic acid-deficient protein Aba4 family protein [Leisingera sp. NJS204]|uniref:abscisic acid-deficient protein Aba4 family protein n=1 Tax=Leisingera sp. NJS204 TaxID=2508307 RepID=UPI0013E902FA|nr:abscisic acid-deficient protein Aba4 family protein [Leisingera sp. NJS204]